MWFSCEAYQNKFCHRGAIASDFHILHSHHLLAREVRYVNIWAIPEPSQSHYVYLFPYQAMAITVRIWPRSSITAIYRLENPSSNSWVDPCNFSWVKPCNFSLTKDGLQNGFPSCSQYIKIRWSCGYPWQFVLRVITLTVEHGRLILHLRLSGFDLQPLVLFVRIRTPIFSHCTGFVSQIIFLALLCMISSLSTGSVCLYTMSVGAE